MLRDARALFNRASLPLIFLFIFFRFGMRPFLRLSFDFIYANDLRVSKTRLDR